MGERPAGKPVRNQTTMGEVKLPTNLDAVHRRDDDGLSIVLASVRFQRRKGGAGGL